MGLTTITAARILRGQHRGQSGEETSLAFDKFEHVALAKTYNIDSQVGDSGACATALLSGVKSRYETLGLDDSGLYENCLSSITARIPCLTDWTQQEGKATGLVTTTRVTHATPAAMYAHSASRYWESDDKMPEDARNTCKDIARQLVEDEPGRHINVILGGGRRHFLPQSIRDPESPANVGRRGDGRNLIEEWLKDKEMRELRHRFVWKKEDFEVVDTGKIDYLLGLFDYSHMTYETDRDSSPSGEPSLAEMTQKAIEILRRNPHGFFLLVEGGRIDHAHHFNNAYRALTDTLALESAVNKALEMTREDDTLIVVTSDHSHVFTFGGHPKRGNPILGTDDHVSDVDSLPYTTLLYSNGPGYSRNFPLGRQNLTGIDTEHKNYVQQSAVPRRWDTHGGEDVTVYAHGPMSHLFRGVFEQTYIPHAMAYAACIGPNKDTCDRGRHNHQTQSHDCPPVEERDTSNWSNRSVKKNSPISLWRMVIITILFGWWNVKCYVFACNECYPSQYKDLI
ncbi:alkaline phosphatase-like [Tachypleus tridentatus]|uniref:alkaline phosphatase-like n=1 Tax=Tachypleus tridentatus TaxID=6853 RepID=UPI003FD11F71